jgi:hypothetical protein
MPVPLRQVRRLRIKCARNEHARHGQILLEDALRTASLRDESRLIIVKRLTLGQFSTRDSATSWSRRLEESIRTQAPEPVTYEHPADEQVSIVSFASPLEPWLLLARNTIAGRACTQWYWRSTLVGWNPSRPVPETLRLCFKTLAAKGGISGTLLLAQHLRTADSLLTLLAALTEADLVPLKADLLNTTDSNIPLSATATHSIALTETMPTAAEQSFLCSANPNILRSAWLAAARISQNQSSSPALFQEVPSPKRIEKVLQHWRLSVSTNRFYTADFPSDHTPLVTEKRPPASQQSNNQSSPTIAPPEKQEPVQPAESTKPDSLPERAFTQAGGLLFLIPLLQRSGLPSFVATLPPEERSSFPWQILATALQHARIDEPDPFAIAMSELPATPHPSGIWLIRANRLALKLTGLNLRHIVRRPALATISPQQIDLFFRTNEADLRLRRTGLDVDPGWVPWLQRVVRYHFNRED